MAICKAFFLDDRFSSGGQVRGPSNGMGPWLAVMNRRWFGLGEDVETGIMFRK